MIPAQDVVASGAVIPWSDQRQVEQDLIIGRALVEVFSDDMLCDAVRIRGGTALNKLHFPKPMRDSEDIDLVRTSGGPMKVRLAATGPTEFHHPARARRISVPVAAAATSAARRSMGTRSDGGEPGTTGAGWTGFAFTRFRARTPARRVP